jgi:hypothetical protein
MNYKLVKITFRRFGGDEVRELTRELTYRLYCELKDRAKTSSPSYSISSDGEKEWYVESLKIVR